jgi:tRNA uridine 5-carbamoylmethylation protein Kti12
MKTKVATEYIPEFHENIIKGLELELENAHKTIRQLLGHVDFLVDQIQIIDRIHYPLPGEVRDIKNIIKEEVKEIKKHVFATKDMLKEGFQEELNMLTEESNDENGCTKSI